MGQFVIKTNTGTGYNYDQDVYDDFGDDEYLYTSFSSTQIKTYDDAANYTVITGSGFSQSSASGEVRSMTIVETGTTLLKADNWSLSVSTLVDLVDDPEGFAAYIFKGNDSISLTGFSDLMRSGAGDDVVFGSSGNDLLAGGSDNDKLNGGIGNDSLYGQADDDTLFGGWGRDTLSGGLGADRFIYTNKGEAGDRITDFSNNDLFVFEGSAFGLGGFSGTLNKANMAVRASSNLARDSDDRFVFRASDKTLWYESDGSGAAAPIQIADLSNNYTVYAVDISII